MILVAVVAVAGLIALCVFLLLDNTRLRRDLVTALTTPPAVAGALINAEKAKDPAVKAEPRPHPLGM